MRVLLTGATGFIGGAVLARLLREGHQVAAVTRRPLVPMAGVSVVRLDLRDATTPEIWIPHLSGVDAVVNCAGVLQDGGSDCTSAVHAQAPAALFRACEIAHVQRVVQISAIGADRETPSDFSKSKAQGDRILTESRLDWVILRPAIVLGAPAYGGSALFRGLAALPVAARIPQAGALQVVDLEQVVDTVLTVLRPDAPARLQLELAAPERLSFGDIVAAYRRWLGYAPAVELPVPSFLMGFVYKLGDVAGLLGWRSPMRSNARLELARGAEGDPKRWMSVTGIAPRSLSDILAAIPAGAQERWFARLYLLKPVLLVTLAGFWVATGLISLGPGWTLGLDIMRGGGVTGAMAATAVAGGALADIAIGVGIAFRRSARVALLAALLLSLVYVAIGTALLPALWIEPLGPMLKILPILALILVALAILDDR